MDLIRKAHELAMRDLQSIREELEKNPELKKEIDYNMNAYGIPFLSGSHGGRWREDLPKDVRNLLFEEMPYQLVEIRIYPEDPDGHHWGVEYSVLRPNGDQGFVKAIDYEQAKKGGEEK